VAELECFPYGTDQADEGVGWLLHMGPYRILLDCGLRELGPLLLHQAPPADLVLCSHAHPDHARGLLPLHQAFPRMPVYASEVTAELLSLNWPSQTATRFCRALPWRTPVEFYPGLSAELIPAGHLPGAAALLLTYRIPPHNSAERDLSRETSREAPGADRPYTVFYTGDFLLSNSRLVDGLPLEDLRGLKPDVLIVEGSYGTARFPHRRQQENQLAERIHRALAEGQSVLMPTTTLGLGQELLMLLRSHHHFTGRDLDIWVDGSVALGCDVYLDMIAHFPETVQNFARHQALFWDERIRPRVRRFAHAGSPKLGQPPCLVLTSQDADLSRYCRHNDASWLLLLPQHPGRLGEVELTVMQALETSDLLQQRLQTGQLLVENYLLSDHCDGAGTTQLIHNLRPQHVVFTHGSPTYLSDLASLEELQNRYHLHMPAVGTQVSLPIGETFLQPVPPETRYEGEVVEVESAVVISFADAITADPRWQSFADTGLVEARWQGEELVLRNLSQRELIDQGLEMTLETECCQNCIHCRGQRCRNPLSPLFGFRVTLSGYCPAFEAVSMSSDLEDSAGEQRELTSDLEFGPEFGPEFGSEFDPEAG
jgi:Cft2 family RNA processing exonuclease